METLPGMPQALIEETKALGEEMKAKVSDARAVIPFIALCTMSGIHDLQCGKEEDQKLAERWLRHLWDIVDLSFVAPALTGGEAVKNPQALASYSALEGYFSSYGNLPKAIEDLSSFTASQTGETWPREELRDLGARLGRIVKQAMIAAHKL